MNKIDNQKEWEAFVGRCLFLANLEGINLTYKQIELVYGVVNGLDQGDQNEPGTTT